MVHFGSLSWGEGWGEGPSANYNHKIAAGFSPQSVQEFFRSINSVEELTVASRERAKGL
jgi:hypothetical protein